MSIGRGRPEHHHRLDPGHRHQPAVRVPRRLGGCAQPEAAHPGRRGGHRRPLPGAFGGGSGARCCRAAARSPIGGESTSYTDHRRHPGVRPRAQRHGDRRRVHHRGATPAGRGLGGAARAPMRPTSSSGAQKAWWARRSASKASPSASSACWNPKAARAFANEDDQVLVPLTTAQTRLLRRSIAGPGGYDPGPGRQRRGSAAG